MIYRHKLRKSCFLLVDITSYSTRCPPLTVKVSPHFKQTLKNDVTGRNSSFCRIASPYGIVIFIKLKPPESRYEIAIAVGRQIVYSIPHCYYFFSLNISQFDCLVKEKKKIVTVGISVQYFFLPNSMQFDYLDSWRSRLFEYQYYIMDCL